MVVTVLTPSFNRGWGLNNLYLSLQKQTIKEFEWLLIDDGSTDDTRNIVEEMKASADFPIRYMHKANGGKHTAINFGLRQVATELTFIVDSDDVLTSDAIEIILHYFGKYGLDERLCGYSFLRRFQDGSINGRLFVPNEKIGTYIESRINADDTRADKAEVFFTRCLREFPFPEYPGEKFLGEDIVWIRMAQKYQMVHINEAIYIGSYLEDGLTKNRRTNNIKSPCGCKDRAREFMRPEIKIKYRIKGAVQYVVYGFFAGGKLVNIINESPNRILTIIFSPIGVLLYRKWKRLYP